MPKAAASAATRRPMFPTPTMPSVLPDSSTLLMTRRACQSPARVIRSIDRTCFTQPSMSMSACSATAWELEPGACTTATPSCVAAGRSTVSSPTPCRPTTLRRGQAAISRSVTRGRARMRRPSASAAARMTPSSLSSLTTTRASRSSCAWPSGWIGPARMTRGRGSGVIERSPFAASSGRGAARRTGPQCTARFSAARGGPTGPRTGGSGRRADRGRSGRPDGAGPGCRRRARRGRRSSSCSRRST